MLADGVSDTMTTAREDGQLLKQMRVGDLDALGALYDRYRMLVFETALAITRDRRAAEDILHRCFLRLHEYVERLDPDQPLAPWLYRSTIDLSRAHLMRPANGWKALDKVLDRLDRLVMPGRAPATHDLQLRAQRAIETLPYNQRVVLILYYLGGLRLKEIAHVLDCPLGTVKSRLHYGRELLRARLADEDVEPHRMPALEVVHDLA